MALTPTNQITVTGLRSSIGTSASAALIASALSATLVSADGDQVYGDASLTVVDAGAAFFIAEHEIIARSVMVTTDIESDLAQIKALKQRPAGLFVLSSFLVDKRFSSMTPFKFAENAGIELAGAVGLDNELGAAHRRGFFDVGYHSAADVKIDPAFEKLYSFVSTAQ